MEIMMQEIAEQDPWVGILTPPGFISKFQIIRLVFHLNFKKSDFVVIVT